MKKQLRVLLSMSTLALLLGVGVSLNAQEDRQRPPEQQNTPSQASPTTPQPDANAQPQTPVGTAQTFTGTVMKSGDKLVLQDASGTSFDVDKQGAIKSFEGKKISIKGTLDPNGKLIHVQQ